MTDKSTYGPVTILTVDGEPEAKAYWLSRLKHMIESSDIPVDVGPITNDSFHIFPWASND